AGPVARGEHRLPPQIGTVEVPFREWVLARIEASLAPRLLTSTRGVANRVEPLARSLSELERRVAFNVELAASELSIRGEEAPPARTKELLREMIGGTLERNRGLFAGYGEASRSSPGRNGRSSATGPSCAPPGRRCRTPARSSMR